MSTIYDAVICLGPNDSMLFKRLINNLKEKIIGLNLIYVISSKKIIDDYIEYSNDVTFIDESIFPFPKKYIDEKFKIPSRSGWYLQQLLKIYAPIVIKNLLENFLILDADVYFHNAVCFFDNDKVLFNIGSENHLPYFEHMKKLDSSLFRVFNCSGICHLMPLKKKFVRSLINKIELIHKRQFWIVFLDLVTQENYEFSGASEYEILFNYIILHFPDEYEIKQLIWRNSISLTDNFAGHYEACHHYNRI